MTSSLLPIVLLLESTLPGNLVPAVRQDIMANQSGRAAARIRSFETTYGATPEMLEALSWLGRGLLAAGKPADAMAAASRTQSLAERALGTRHVDSDPRLTTALGAAVEVQGQALAQEGGRAEAVAYLQAQLARYRDSSIRNRIQKNINLLSLEGKPAPAIEAREYLGSEPPDLAALKGHPVLLFFWAHWCPDCKAMGPIVAAAAAKFRARGLVVIAPTQRYGYIARGASATPAEELRYIDQARRRNYPGLLHVPVPVSETMFNEYGSSTIPTLVLIDRQGIVRLYRPGMMSEADLSARLENLLR